MFGTNSALGKTVSPSHQVRRKSASGISNSKDTVAVAWEAYYDHPREFHSTSGYIAADGRGNYFVAGSSESTWTYIDMQVIKYNGQGKQLWRQTYDGPSHDFDNTMGIASDADGNVYITGYSTGNSIPVSGAQFYAYDIATIKYDPSGNLIWVARFNSGYGDAIPAAIAVDQFGDVTVTGACTNAHGDQDFCTLEYDHNGVFLWVRTFDGSLHADDGAYAMATDSSANIYVTGFVNTIDSGANILTLAYSPDGNLLWSAQYDDPFHLQDLGFAIALGDSGSVYVVGVSQDTGMIAGYSHFKAVTIKYSNTGAMRWAITTDSTQGPVDAWFTAAVDHKGNVCVGGGSDTRPPEEIPYYDVAEVSYTSRGTQRWFTRTHSIYDVGSILAETIDDSDNILAAGGQWVNSLGPSYMVQKYTTSGVRSWSTYYDSTTSEFWATDGWAEGIVFDPTKQHVVITGTMVDTSQNDHAVTAMLATNIGMLGWRTWFEGYGSSSNVGPITTEVDHQGNIYELLSDGVAKYSPDGTLLWKFPVHTSGATTAQNMSIDTSGNVVTLGSDVSNLGARKISPSGTLLWATNDSIPGDGSTICAGIDGSVIVGGNSQGGTAVKYSPEGDLLWKRTARIHTGGNFSYVATDRNGNVYWVGDGPAGGSSTYKYSSSGDSLWWAYQPDIYLWRINVSPAGQLVITGIKNDTGNSQTIRYDANGRLLWAIDSPVGAEVEAIATDQSENTFTVAYGGEGSDLFQRLDKYNPQGTLVWEQTLSDSEAIFNLAVDRFGSIYAGATGIDYARYPLEQLEAIKFDSSGNEIWRTRFDSLHYGGTNGPLVALDSLDHVYLTGTMQGPHSLIAVTIKYQQLSPVIALQYSSRTLSYPGTQLGCSSRDTVVIQNPTWYPHQLTIMGDTNFVPMTNPLPLSVHGSAAMFISFSPLLQGNLSGNVLVVDSSAGTVDTIYVRGTGLGDTTSTLIHITPGIGWAMLSSPLNSPCEPILPSLFEYASHYQSVSSMASGNGYWSKLQSPDVYFAGDSRVVDTITLNARWNMIGSITMPVAVNSLVGQPGTMIVSPFYGYYGPDGYHSTDTIYPGRGYWVKASEIGRLILGSSGGSMIASVTRLRIVNDGELPPPPPGGASSGHTLLQHHHPQTFALEQNYPEPFNPTTKIRYSLPKPGWVSLKIYDLLGREVETLVNEFQTEGMREVIFYANGLPSGIYFYSLSTSSGFYAVRKLVVLK